MSSRRPHRLSNGDAHVLGTNAHDRRRLMPVWRMLRAKCSLRLRRPAGALKSAPCRDIAVSVARCPGLSFRRGWARRHRARDRVLIRRPANVLPGLELDRCLALDGEPIRQQDHLRPAHAKIGAISGARWALRLRGRAGTGQVYIFLDRVAVSEQALGRRPLQQRGQGVLYRRRYACVVGRRGAAR